MAQLQIVFDKLQAIQSQIKEIKAMYKDVLDSDPGYAETKEKLKKLRTITKEIENGVKAEMAKDMEKLGQLQLAVKYEKESMADAAVSKLLKGENVSVKAGDVELVPVFSVKFKKV